MVDQRSTRSRGLLAPVLGGVLLIVALVLAIYFRVQLWDFIKFVGRNVGHWLTVWVPNHPGQTFSIVAFAVLAFAINWFAHVSARLRAWVFALVVEIGLWLLFWYGVGIPSLNKLFGLNIEHMPFGVVAASAACVIALTGVVFWFLELREEYRKYRHRTEE